MELLFGVVGVGVEGDVVTLVGEGERGGGDFGSAAGQQPLSLLFNRAGLGGGVGVALTVSGGVEGRDEGG